MTRKQHLEETASIRTERDLLLLALQCAVTEQPDVTEKATQTVDGWRYRYDLYRATSPHGGMVVVTATLQGQRPFVVARYLDDLRGETHTLSVPIEQRIAIDRLFVARTRLADFYREHGMDRGTAEDLGYA